MLSKYRHWTLDLVDEAKVSGLSPLCLLGYCYMNIGEYEKAIEVWDEFVQLQPSAPRIYTYMVSCREKLAEQGKLNLGPMVIKGSRPLPNGMVLVKGTLLVPVSELPKFFQVKINRSEISREFVIESTNLNVSPITFTESKNTAIISGKSIKLPVAPIKKGNDLLVPLRIIAQHFGTKVKWDNLSK